MSLSKDGIEYKACITHALNLMMEEYGDEIDESLDKYLLENVFMLIKDKYLKDDMYYVVTDGESKFKTLIKDAYKNIFDEGVDS